MARPGPATHRTWQDIARELACETDSDKVTELAEELSQALRVGELSKYGPFKRD